MFDGADTIFHFAAILVAYDPSAFDRMNGGRTRSVLARARPAGVKHCIKVSSRSLAYPNTTGCSRSKREGERRVRSEAALHWTIVRPTLA